MNNPLIFGRNNLERITSVEVKDNTLEIFMEAEDGTVSSIEKPVKHWLLAPAQLDREFTQLDGKLYYNWIKLYDDKAKYQKDRGMYYKRDAFSVGNSKEAAMTVYGFTYFKGMKVEDVSVLSFDIETNGFVHDNNSTVYIISNTYRSKGRIERRMFSIDDYPSQAAMLDAWCEWVRKVNPSVLCGHNIFGFDIPFLEHTAVINETSLKLGRDKSDLWFEEDFRTGGKKISKFRKDGSQAYEYTRCHVYGREIVDTMFLSYKYDFSRKYLSYGLKQIIKQEGLEIEGRQFYDAGTISQNWDNLEERAKIKAYAEQDGDDALALYDLMIPSFFYWNQSIPKSFQELNYSATGSQINAFLVRSYLQDFHSIPKATEAEKFVGAISFGVPGIYKNVFKVDVASLYPSIMLQFEVYDRYKDPKGHFFKMVSFFTEERLKNKKLGKETGDRYYKDLEQSQKIGINSAYGMLGATGLAFNSPKNAAFVTTKGREILEKAVEWASSKPVSYWTSIGDVTDESEEESA